MPRRPSVPKYRLHKQSGQAIVTLRDPATGKRRDILLGPHDSPQSRQEYARVIAAWSATGRPPAGGGPAPTDLTVNELLVTFFRHAEGYYRDPDGIPTSELTNLRHGLRAFKESHGHTVAADFGPPALKALRDAMARSGLARSEVNRRLGHVRRVYRWAAGEGLVPASTYVELGAVPWLKRGRSPARETEPVAPADPAAVEKTLPFLPPPVRAMVELQRLTGMRPGEACRLTPGEVDRAGDVWLYRPARHKTAHRGKARVVAIGPKAQAVLAPFLLRAGGDYCFSPAESVAAVREARRAARKSKVPPSQADRSKPGAKKPGQRYNVRSYPRAVERACDRADAAERARLAAAGTPAKDGERLVPRWHPNQLRHLHATEVRRLFGLEAAQVVLGHAKADVTQVYAERDQAAAERVARAIG